MGMLEVVATLKSQRAQLLSDVARINSAINALGGSVKAATKATKKPASKKKSMTAAKRKAVSERMKKYWAGRKKKSKKSSK